MVNKIEVSSNGMLYLHFQDKMQAVCCKHDLNFMLKSIKIALKKRESAENISRKERGKFFKIEEIVR